MYTEVIKAKLRHTTQIITAIAILFGGYLAGAYAQPMLNPEQTVNTATGEMMFSLPLETVNGINGKGFPISLNYGAGVRLHQEATPAGLGFSYEPGFITRKEVFVPDEGIGGLTNYDYFNDADVNISWWYWAVTGLIIIFSIVLTFATGGMAFWTCAVWISAVTVVAGAASFVVNYVAFGPSNYIAGHEQSVAYSTANHTGGTGIMRGATNDIPDVYFISTPFISGEMRWVEGDRFVFRRTEGSNIHCKETVKIRYDINTDKFYITLADGTRLFFEKSKKAKKFTEVYSQNSKGSAVEAYSFMMNEQKQPISTMWALTKVLYNDYVDGGDGSESDITDDNPMNSLNKNRGSWLVFEYEELIHNDVRQLPECAEISRNKPSDVYSGGTMVSTTGDLLHELNLRYVRTPNEYAEFKYTYDRKDDLWFEIDKMDWWEKGEPSKPGEEALRENNTATYICKSNTDTNAVPVARGVLDSINIYSASGVKRTMIHFNTDYYLRPSTMHSYTKGINYEFDTLPGNPAAACLTLKSIDICGNDGTKYPPVKFKYYDKNPRGWNKNNAMNALGPKPVKFYKEERDLWGYYYPCNDYQNTFNHSNSSGDVAKEACVWSLDEVTLPTGLKIKWEYESHKYDASNGIKNICGSDKRPLFGGGIRVKKIIADNGVSNPVSWRYVYTCDKGAFVEKILGDTTNVSGHATAEPYDFMFQGIDYRTESARRGGTYAPAKVAYEMVQVITNYQEPDRTHPNGIAPEGYTTYRYLTSLEHPNGGEFGDIDSSWKRGYLVEKEVYNQAGDKISSELNTYEFEDETVLNEGRINLLNDALFTESTKFTMGVIKHTVKSGTVNDVSMKNKMIYKTSAHNGKQVVIDTVQMTTTVTKDIKYNGGWGNIVCTNLDNNPQDDLLIIHSSAELLPTISKLVISHIKNIDIKNSVNPYERWELSGLLKYDNIWIDEVVGVGYVDIGGNSSVKDVLVLLNTRSSLGTGIKVVGFIDNAGDGTRFDADKLDVLADKKLNTAVVYDFNNNGIPDILLYTGGALESVVTKLYIVSDIRLNSTYTKLEHGAVYTSSENFTINSKHAGALFYDDNATIDLMCSAPDYTSGDCNTRRIPLNRSIIKDIVMNSGDFTISTGGQKAIDPAFILRNRDDVVCETEAPNMVPRYMGFGINTQKEQYYVYGTYLTHCKDSIISRDLDGKPDQTVTYFNNDTMLVTVPTPAYIHKPQMGDPAVSGNRHMIAQTSDEAVYKVLPSYTLPIDPTLNYANAVSSKTLTWSLDEGRYLPRATYKWEMPMNYDGMPVAALSVFNHDEETANADWQMSDSICKYNRQSLPQEKVNVLDKTNRLRKTTIYGHKGRLPIAEITNAQWDECGVFTGDYNTGINSNFWDYENGWEHGASDSVQIIGDPAHCHFGDSVIHTVNDYAAGRNNKIIPGTSYEMTAWVKVKSGVMLMGADFRWIPKDKENKWPEIGMYLTRDLGFDPVYDTVSASESAGKWKMMKITIPAEITSKLPESSSRVWYARAWVGKDPADFPVEGYVDDIRFSPVGAYVNTTYYHPALQLPVISVDANNQPGNRVTYDGFGRPVRWDKIDVTKSRNDAMSSKAIQTKQYVFTRDGINILQPSREKVGAVGFPLEIKWTNEKEYDVEIYISPVDTPSWQYITTVIHTPGVSDYSFSWTVTDVPEGKYQIRVQSTPGAKVFDNSEIFTIILGKVISPAKWSVWQPGSNLDVKYLIYQDPASPVTIYLNEAVIGTGLNTGSFLWGIPADYLETDNAVIRIECNGHNIYSDVFSIKKHSFIRRYIFNLLNNK